MSQNGSRQGTPLERRRSVIDHRSGERLADIEIGTGVVHGKRKDGAGIEVRSVVQGVRPGIGGVCTKAVMELPLKMKLQGVVVRACIIAVENQSLRKRRTQRNDDNRISQSRDGTGLDRSDQVPANRANVRGRNALLSAERLLHG